MFKLLVLLLLPFVAGVVVYVVIAEAVEAVIELALDGFVVPVAVVVALEGSSRRFLECSLQTKNPQK